MSQGFLKNSMFLVDLLCNVSKTIWRPVTSFGLFSSKHPSFSKKRLPGSVRQASLCRSLTPHFPIVYLSRTPKPLFLIVPTGNLLLPLAVWHFFPLVGWGQNFQWQVPPCGQSSAISFATFFPALGWAPVLAKQDPVPRGFQRALWGMKITIGKVRPREPSVTLISQFWLWVLLVSTWSLALDSLRITDLSSFWDERTGEHVVQPYVPYPDVQMETLNPSWGSSDMDMRGIRQEDDSSL